MRPGKAVAMAMSRQGQKVNCLRCFAMVGRAEPSLLSQWKKEELGGQAFTRASSSRWFAANSLYPLAIRNLPLAICPHPFRLL
ncbi:MAG: hypothetical protein Q7T75_00015, partial [Mesorhizobium sp.]|nr:hypothetical protein [Mesorhizobium sp.]